MRTLRRAASSDSKREAAADVMPNPKETVAVNTEIHVSPHTPCVSRLRVLRVCQKCANRDWSGPRSSWRHFSLGSMNPAQRDPSTRLSASEVIRKRRPKGGRFALCKTQIWTPIFSKGAAKQVERKHNFKMVRIHKGESCAICNRPLSGLLVQGFKCFGGLISRTLITMFLLHF